ncbi:MAG: polysaccharide biosynthesis/export family protein [Thermoguttaceae bacterium]
MFSNVGLAEDNQYQTLKNSGTEPTSGRRNTSREAHRPYRAPVYLPPSAPAQHSNATKLSVKIYPLDILPDFIDTESVATLIQGVAYPEGMPPANYMQFPMLMLSKNGNAAIVIAAPETQEQIAELLEELQNAYKEYKNSVSHVVPAQCQPHQVSPETPITQESSYILESPDIISVSLHLVEKEDELLQKFTTECEGVAGLYRIEPDGFITLGDFGRVYVSGLTLAECAEAIKLKTKPYEGVWLHCDVSVDVYSFNSKNFYVVFRKDGAERVLAYPFTGNGKYENMRFIISEIDRKFPFESIAIQLRNRPPRWTKPEWYVTYSDR